DVATIVPDGVAKAVLLRLARFAPAVTPLACGLSVLGDGAQVGDAARLAGLAGGTLEAAMAGVVVVGVVKSGGTACFSYSILRAAIYGELLLVERERLYCDAAKILLERGAPIGQVAAQVMHTEPAVDRGVVTVMRDAAHVALAL